MIHRRLHLGGLIMLMAGSVLTTCPCLSLSHTRTRTLYAADTDTIPEKFKFIAPHQPTTLVRLSIINVNSNEIESIRFIPLQGTANERGIRGGGEKFRHAFHYSPFFFLFFPTRDSSRNLSNASNDDSRLVVSLIRPI